MSIRAIIVDDEPLARRGLEIRLREAPDVEIVRQCGKRGVFRVGIFVRFDRAGQRACKDGDFGMFADQAFERIHRLAPRAPSCPIRG